MTIDEIDGVNKPGQVKMVIDRLAMVEGALRTADVSELARIDGAIREANIRLDAHYDGKIPAGWSRQLVGDPAYFYVRHGDGWTAHIDPDREVRGSYTLEIYTSRVRDEDDADAGARILVDRFFRSRKHKTLYEAAKVCELIIKERFEA